MTDQPSNSAWPFAQDLWMVLGRYVAGELAPHEADEVRRWLAEDPSRIELIQRLSDVTAGRRTVPPGLDLEAALRRVSARKNDPAVLRAEAARGWMREYGWSALRIAAVVALAVGGTAIWRSFAGTVAPADRYVTKVGHTLDIKLRDGSHIMLAPSSQLVVLPGYFASGREVELTGEAYFEVRHNPAMPFRVHTGNADIEDLGTTFNVRSEGDGEVQVVVASGSVAMQDTTHHQARLMLRAGDRGTLQRGGTLAAEHNADTTAALAWTRGRVRFDNATLAHVQVELRRWYGVELAAGDTTVASKHITASFGSEPADQVVSIIALTLGAQVEHHGDTVVLKTTPAGGAARR